MKTAVITTVHGRHVHLRNQIRGLRYADSDWDHHVVVALGDPGVGREARRDGHRVEVVELAATSPLPLAKARNAGARCALAADAELLVFLDVDCIPAAGMIARYRRVAELSEHRDALLCGPVTYLPPAGPGGYNVTTLDRQTRPHPARPAPADGTVLSTTDYALFWSLSFAVRRATWERIGGFCEEYVGYGGEDTDFGQTAAALGVPMRWVGGAHAYHQYHPVENPPVRHRSDIVRNARIFHRRWGIWPMEGWLTEFAERGVITRDADGTPRLTG
ncbi:glycosyltransferase family 2 protein [Mycolicibacterium flavescens]|uniref:Sugar transferase n=1 Tax=Mycolicibacterium flavescens TaxID=1776 RepID=A0A1E3RII0_MYCFV|nr:galactosyltransferase-related protein [Mycolicibacterium flavescens]MCV7282177.1 glycosyltransferase family 2 protein [Mycolicibacterium flavescens]ODQ89674.1 sugar transferase [Mycolicibacterium flavescens]